MPRSIDRVRTRRCLHVLPRRSFAAPKGLRMPAQYCGGVSINLVTCSLVVSWIGWKSIPLVASTNSTGGRVKLSAHFQATILLINEKEGNPITCIRHSCRSYMVQTCSQDELRLSVRHCLLLATYSGVNNAVKQGCAQNAHLKHRWNRLRAVLIIFFMYHGIWNLLKMYQQW